MGWMAVESRFDSWQWESLFSSPQHPGSSPVGTTSSHPDGNMLGHEANHSPPSSTRLRMSGAMPPLPQMPSSYGA